MNEPMDVRPSHRSNAKAGGPMGLDELTHCKWLGLGNGQIRT
jgi:gamma-glutamyl phosphate reductase